LKENEKMKKFILLADVAMFLVMTSQSSYAWSEQLQHVQGENARTGGRL
jgi:hypothetical protein